MYTKRGTCAIYVMGHYITFCVTKCYIFSGKYFWVTPSKMGPWANTYTQTNYIDTLLYHVYETWDMCHIKWAILCNKMLHFFREIFLVTPSKMGPWANTHTQTNYIDTLLYHVYETWDMCHIKWAILCNKMLHFFREIFLVTPSKMGPWANTHTQTNYIDTLLYHVYETWDMCHIKWAILCNKMLHFFREIFLVTPSKTVSHPRPYISTEISTNSERKFEKKIKKKKIPDLEYH